MYDKAFGICNHSYLSKKRPISSVGYHTAEEVNDGCLLEQYIRSYVDKRIWNIFHISLNEYLELPSDVIDMLHVITGEENAKNASTLSSIEEEFNK